jgi:hypothetical protein
MKLGRGGKEKETDRVNNIEIHHICTIEDIMIYTENC